MKVGIIAAGRGERLRPGGWLQPKPLVPVGGKPLIDYALEAVTVAGLHEIACIVNEESRGVAEHCRSRWPALRFEFVQRSTPSSMESLFALRPLLAARRFVLLTVDAVFAPAVLPRFLRAGGGRADADGVLAVHGFVDDEKPLWVQLAGGRRITAIGRGAKDSGLVTAGFYAFEPVIFAEIDAARRLQLSALREFLGHLLARGYRLYGERVPKTVDVDRPEDITVAEAFVRNGFER
ncbi:MAG: NDP-sugar synthase [Candidatus Binatia bacterium]